MRRARGGGGGALGIITGHATDTAFNYYRSGRIDENDAADYNPLRLFAARPIHDDSVFSLDANHAIVTVASAGRYLFAANVNLFMAAIAPVGSHPWTRLIRRHGNALSFLSGTTNKDQDPSDQSIARAFDFTYIAELAAGDGIYLGTTSGNRIIRTIRFDANEGAPPGWASVVKLT